MRKYHIFNPSTNPLLRWDAPALQSGTNYPSAAWFYQRESARHNAFQPILSTYYIQVKQNKLRTPETFISYIWQKQKSSIVPLLSGWRRAHSIIRWYTTVWQGRFIRSTNYFPQSGKDIDNQERKKGICWIPFKPFCGENRIRTCEPVLPVTRFPGVPLQPLEHLSKNLTAAKLHKIRQPLYRLHQFLRLFKHYRKAAGKSRCTLLVVCCATSWSVTP